MKNYGVNVKITIEAWVDVMANDQWEAESEVEDMNAQDILIETDDLEFERIDILKVELNSGDDDDEF